MMDPAPVTAGLRRIGRKWKPEDAAHLLRRTLFGASRADLDHFSRMSPKKAVRELVYRQYPAPSPPLNYYNDDKYTDPEIPTGQTWTQALKFDGMNNGRRRNSYKSWWIGQMINQDRSIREKMVLFWHNHFVTETNSVDNARFCYQYNVLLRQYALGNFRDLVKAMTKEPAMLRYLNGAANTKKAPDENYGRELQELFTIGKGPGSHYTEDDVRAAARVLTGYTVNYKIYASSFDPRRHDEGDKQFSAFYGNRLIRGRKGPEGEEELDELVDMIFSKDEVSLFICRKLYRFFVYHRIDEMTEQEVIRPLAALFRKKKYEIGPVLETLLASRHFFDTANRGGMIKSPLDLTVGLCRTFNVTFPDGTEGADQYGFWEQVRGQAAALQQNIGDPPNVAGWQAFYQEPEYDRLWISSDTLPRRNQWTDKMIGNGLGRAGKKVQIDPFAMAAGLEAAEDPDRLIAAAVKTLYPTMPGTETLAFIKTNILLSGLAGMVADHYWTNAWLAYLTTPDEKVGKAIVQNKLKLLFKYMMDLPEYQLM